jgi:hypothetical protein
LEVFDCQSALASCIAGRPKFRCVTGMVGIRQYRHSTDRGDGTQNDGAWIKNVAEEAPMVDAMRKGADLTVKGTSGRGTTSTDQYSLKGLAQALDKIEQECK